MSKLLAMTLLTITLTTTTANGGLVSMGFDDGTGTGNAIENFYSSLGITFSDAAWNDAFDGRPGTSSPFQLASLSTPHFPKENNPIVGVLSAPVDMLSISAIDVGFNDARLDAYDATTGGNLIASSVFEGVSELGNTRTPADTGILAVAAVGIRRIELYQPNSVTPNDGVSFDNLSFNVVPEPPTSAMILALFGSLLALQCNSLRLSNRLQSNKSLTECLRR